VPNGNTGESRRRPSEYSHRCNLRLKRARRRTSPVGQSASIRRAVRRSPSTLPARAVISRLPELSNAFDRDRGVNELGASSKAATQIGTLLTDLERLARRLGVGGAQKCKGRSREALQ
jgi:hypothetical protein